MADPAAAAGLAEQMRALLADLQPQALHIEDQSAAHAGHAGAAGGGGHFELHMVSAAFAGLSPVQRHRLIYARLAPLMAGRIHALAMRLRTPEEAQAQSSPS
jgi:BolA protein